MKLIKDPLVLVGLFFSLCLGFGYANLSKGIDAIFPAPRIHKSSQHITAQKEDVDWKQVSEVDKERK